MESRRIDEAIRHAIEQGIHSRSYSYGSSFGVGSAVEGYVKEAAAKWRTRLSSSPFGSSDIEREVAKIVDSRQAADGQGQIFQQTNAQMIATLRELVL